MKPSLLAPSIRTPSDCLPQFRRHGAKAEGCHGALRKAALLLTGLISVAASVAQAETVRFSCWDETFAYTLVGIIVSKDEVHVRITSQDETIFEPLLPIQNAEWGQAILDVWFEPEGCVVDMSKHSFSCRSTPISSSFQYSPVSSQQREILTPEFGMVRIELLSIEHPGAQAEQSTQHILVVGTQHRSHAETLLIDFPSHQNCDGWPDPFALN